MSPDLEEKNKKAAAYLRKLYDVPESDVFVRAVPRERDVTPAGATVAQRELYYTEVALEVRLAGPGLSAERKAAEKASKPPKGKKGAA